MLYPTHLIIGAIIGILTDLSLLGVVAGSAIPDIIDKPLPKLGIVDTYHSLAHSILALIIVAPLTLIKPFFIAFWVGWFVHTLSDVFHVILNGRTSDWKFILWPFDFQDEPMRKPPGEFFRYYIGTRGWYVELVILLAFVILLVLEY